MNEKHTIINRNGLKLVLLVEAKDESAHKLAFVAHGQKGSKNQPHIEAFARAFLENDYIVVRFDATHSVGESEGALYDVTYNSYISDLEDVIEWSRMQPWFKEPFALCGHSMGAQSTTWYAEHHPESVSLLAAMAPVVNYDMLSSTMDSEAFERYKQLGYKEVPSSSQPGVIHRIGWKCQESLKKYDILPLANQLTMPVLDIVGSNDTPCPPAHQEIFMNAIAGDTTLMVIDGLQHSYRNAQTDKVDDGMSKIETALRQWIEQNS
jgi:pimeloyl-ACP methyl ester carboxylesterase